MKGKLSHKKDKAANVSKTNTIANTITANVWLRLVSDLLCRIYCVGSTSSGREPEKRHKMEHFNRQKAQQNAIFSGTIGKPILRTTQNFYHYAVILLFLWALSTDSLPLAVCCRLISTPRMRLPKTPAPQSKSLF